VSIKGVGVNIARKTKLSKVIYDLRSRSKVSHSVGQRGRISRQQGDNEERRKGKKGSRKEKRISTFLETEA